MRKSKRKGKTATIMGTESLADLKPLRRRLIITVNGQPKTGKTRFLLTAPKPLVYFNFDEGFDPDENPMREFMGEDIQVFHRKLPVDPLGLREENIDRYKEIWQDFEEVHTRAMQDDSIRSIGWDSGSEIWEIARMVYLGRLTNVKSHHYTEVNARFKALTRMANEYRKNLIITHHVKPLYQNDMRTENFEPSGFSGVEAIAQCNTWTYFDPDEDPAFWMKVSNCRYEPFLADRIFEGRMLEFKFIAQAAFPESDLEDWE